MQLSEQNNRFPFFYGLYIYIYIYIVLLLVLQVLVILIIKLALQLSSRGLVGGETGTDDYAKKTYAEKDLLRQNDLPGFATIGCYTQ